MKQGWKKHLNKSDLRHIAETTNRQTLTEFINNRLEQMTTDNDCMTCRLIAMKIPGIDARIEKALNLL